MKRPDPITPWQVREAAKNIFLILLLGLVFLVFVLACIFVPIMLWKVWEESPWAVFGIIGLFLVVTIMEYYDTMIAWFWNKFIARKP